jgi:hypothetical protein
LRIWKSLKRIKGLKLSHPILMLPETCLVPSLPKYLSDRAPVLRHRIKLFNFQRATSSPAYQSPAQPEPPAFLLPVVNTTTTKRSYKRNYNIMSRSRKNDRFASSHPGRNKTSRATARLY